MEGELPAAVPADEGAADDGRELGLPRTLSRFVVGDYGGVVTQAHHVGVRQVVVRPGRCRLDGVDRLTAVGDTEGEGHEGVGGQALTVVVRTLRSGEGVPTGRSRATNSSSVIT